jgi:uncharacterized protein YjbI with pentapeptide repeats
LLAVTNKGHGIKLTVGEKWQISRQQKLKSCFMVQQMEHLNNLNFSDLDFSGLDFSRVTIASTIFSNTSLSKAKFNKKIQLNAISEKPK